MYRNIILIQATARVSLNTYPTSLSFLEMALLVLMIKSFPGLLQSCFVGLVPAAVGRVDCRNGKLVRTFRWSSTGDNDFSKTPLGARHCVPFLRHWETATKVWRACTPPPTVVRARPCAEFSLTLGLASRTRPRELLVLFSAGPRPLEGRPRSAACMDAPAGAWNGLNSPSFRGRGM